MSGTQTIAEDEEDDDDDDDAGSERPVVTKSLPVKNKSAAERLPVVSSGEEECFWCSRVLDKNKMKKIVMAGLPAYKCERC